VLVLFGGLTLALVMVLAQTSTTLIAHAMSLSPLSHTPAAVSNVTASTPTTITLISLPNPAAVSQTVIFTATVHIPPYSATPTGSVQFQVDDVNLGSAVSLTGRQASMSTSWSATGTHTITAMYSGDANFGASTSVALSQCAGCSILASTNADSFILSNEPPGYLIHQLIAGGYGNLNLYSTLTYISQESNPTVADIITPAFLHALKSVPAGSPIFTTLLNQVDFDGAVAISTDGTAQFVEIYGQNYNGTSGTTTLKSSIAGVGYGDFLNSSSGYPNPVTSRNSITGSGSSITNTTYNVIGIGWGVGNYSLYLPLIMR
jgi:hypothetical protein